jgi:hypothetical protein
VTIRRVRGLLDDVMRSGSPEPSLLPWLAELVAEADLVAVAAAAAAVGRASPGAGWPVIADAVAAVLADRVDAATVGPALAALPPVAGRLSRTQAATVDWSSVPPDALGHALLARLPVGRAPSSLPDPPWSTVLAASRPLPLLADPEALLDLAVARRPTSGDRAIYLFPHRSDLATDAVAAITANVSVAQPWFTAAAVTRALPYLDPVRQAELVEAVGALPAPWGSHLRGLLARRHRAWRSAGAELMASHPAMEELTTLAADVDRDELADLAAATARSIGRGTGAVPPSTTRGIGPGLDPRQLTRTSKPDGPTPTSPLPGVPVAPGPDRPHRVRGPGDVPAPGRGSQPETLEDRDADPRRRQVVSTGLARPDSPRTPWERTACTTPDTAYLYWLTVAPEQTPGALELGPQPLHLPPDAGPGTVLTVALFAFPDELVLTRGADVGELRIGDDGTIAPVPRPGLLVDDGKLFFPIRTPDRVGRFRLRCNLYCRQTLLQSRLLEVEVAPPGAETRDDALHSDVDYLVENTLAPAALRRVEPLTLSVFMNDNGDGTHGFRFFGDEGEIKIDTSLPATELQNAVTLAREALDAALFVDRRRPTDDDLTEVEFRYDGRRERDLDDDLIELARRGRQLYTAIMLDVAAAWTGRPARGHPLPALEARLRRPATIEFASKRGAGPVVPAALFYDYPLDTQPDRLTVCPTARQAIDAHADLEHVPCFQGRCPAQEVYDPFNRIVCPSGFWGFRHRIGLPQSLAPGETATGNWEIDNARALRCVVGVATEFVTWPGGGDNSAVPPGRVHVEGVSQRDVSGSPYFDSRADLLAALRRSSPHLVYLYCHGAVVNSIPGLLVGHDDPAITPTEIEGGGMYWEESRPLVVLNGCRTAAVEPQYVMSFVKAFVRGARASGVVGTEVTTYERLATRFADVMLAAFFEATPVAECLRRARLTLLAEGNPLGLIYTAHAAPQLRLARAQPH